LQQKLLGPMAVCPGWQLELEQAALAASVATAQHLPLTWMFGRAQVGTQLPALASRSWLGWQPPPGGVPGVPGVPPPGGVPGLPCLIGGAPAGGCGGWVG
jgi:hypothetical protein